MYTFSLLKLKPRLTAPLLAFFVILLIRAMPAAAQGRGGFGPQGKPLAFDNDSGFVKIFDGKTLNNWDGKQGVWSVQDGAIVASSTPDNPTGTQFIIYKGDTNIGDFDLKLEVKETGSGNGGVQFRSRQEERQGTNRNGQPYPPNPWFMQGYQADFSPDGRYFGQLYEGGGRGITTAPGQAVILNSTENQPDRLVTTLLTPDEVKAALHQDDWNQYEIIAQGDTIYILGNGKLLSVTTDANASMRAQTGMIGVEVEGNNTTVSYRNIMLKKLN